MSDCHDDATHEFMHECAAAAAEADMLIAFRTDEQLDPALALSGCEALIRVHPHGRMNPHELVEALRRTADQLAEHITEAQK